MGAAVNGSVQPGGQSRRQVLAGTPTFSASASTWNSGSCSWAGTAAASCKMPTQDAGWTKRVSSPHISSLILLTAARHASNRRCHKLPGSLMRALRRPWPGASASGSQSCGECQRTKSTSVAPGLAALNACMSVQPWQRAVWPSTSNRQPSHDAVRWPCRPPGTVPERRVAVWSFCNACAPSADTPSSSCSRTRSSITSSVMGVGSCVTGS